jgi:hypothetical protein
MGQHGYRWTIPLAELRGTHNANDRLQDSLLALMRVVVTVHHPDGRTTTNVRLLGDNETDRKAGTLTFELSQKLVELMRDSTIFGELFKAHMRTKYIKSKTKIRTNSLWLTL